jgi:outer membrane biosynthesis protein TonB
VAEVIPEPELEIESEPEPIVEIMPEPEPEPEPVIEVIHEPKPEPKKEQESQADEEAGLFEERQKLYLLGRKVTKNILDRKGAIIAKEGTEITEAIIENAKKEGKMVQLVMNNRA